MLAAGRAMAPSWPARSATSLPGQPNRDSRHEPGFYLPRLRQDRQPWTRRVGLGRWPVKQALHTLTYSLWFARPS